MYVPKTFPKWGEWQGLKTLGMAIRTREVNGTETGEVQYYIASINRNAETYATAVRGLWGVENACHWSLNIKFGETRSELTPATVLKTKPGSAASHWAG